MTETIECSLKEVLYHDAKYTQPPFLKEGDEVAEGTIMIVVEAMKMENNIVASGKARVKKILVKENQMVDNKMQLVELEQ